TGTPGRWMRSAAPGRKVSVAPAGVTRQEATAGWVPWVSLGSAKAAADTAACHAPSRLAAANPGGKLPESCPETATAPMSSVTGVAAARRSARSAARRAAALGYG